jgi:predicted O-linked N-acetylglucosamine transferase (SPINDLY family)
LREAEQWASIHAAGPVSATAARRGRKVAGLETRLHIGYVSPDFRDHCQSLFTVPLLSHHDHSEFKIHCYAQLPAPDATSRRLEGFADLWRSIHGASDAEVESMIRSDGIDILVDLTMHMSNGRPLLFARKPAPVQVAWLAYPGTTGQTAIDFRLTDPWLDPLDFDDHRYVERSIRLPSTFWCYDPGIETPAVNTLPALAAGYVTFGCLNNFCKVSDPSLHLWGRILAAVHGSRLILLAAPGTHRSRVVEILRGFGIAANRIEFIPYQARHAYLETYQRIDLCLDTLPYNGHTTSLDAYWMGVPVITRVGSTVVGRAGWSQLNNLNLPELAAFDDAQFVHKAVELATNLAALGKLRDSLRERMLRSPLMDAAAFAAAMESVYRRVLGMT